MIDLEAIRARDAAEGAGDEPESFYSCASDRRALLEEVDRLNLRIQTLVAAMEVIKASISVPSPGIDDNLLSDLRKAMP